MSFVWKAQLMPRMSSKFFLFVSLVALTIPIPNAQADEQMTPLAEGGDWVAASHSDSMTDAPDVCIAFNPTANLGLRVDQNDVELRYGNDKWSLPDNVTGKIDLKISSHDYSLDIASNTNDQVMAILSDDQLAKLVADMNVSSSMSIQAGSGPPIAVSLAGSNSVITAFLTCAGKNQPGSTGGTNPFGNSQSQ